MEPKPSPVRKIDNFRGLAVWQKSMDLAQQCCRISSAFPPRGFTLGTHVQKTAIAIPSNLAEGHELQTASFRYHVRVALGSLAELDTQLELAARLGFLRATSGAHSHRTCTNSNECCGRSARRSPADCPNRAARRDAQVTVPIFF